MTLTDAELRDLERFVFAFAPDVGLRQVGQVFVNLRECRKLLGEVVSAHNPYNMVSRANADRIHAVLGDENAL